MAVLAALAGRPATAETAKQDALLAVAQIMVPVGSAVQEEARDSAAMAAMAVLQVWAAAKQRAAQTATAAIVVQAATPATVQAGLVGRLDPMQAAEMADGVRRRNLARTAA